jgi:PRC-barrel domain
VQRGEELSLTAYVKGDPMNLTRLPFTQHPRPHQRELRQRGVFDSGDRLIGHVVNIYVDDEENFRFVDVAMGGFMGFGKKHHLVPVEAIAEEEPGTITLRVDRRTVQSAPTLGDPHAAPDEGLQRATREHCGLAAVPPEP